MIYEKEVSGDIDQGDIVKLKIRDWIPWWADDSAHPIVILTPTCDIAHKKADHHRFTILQPLILLFLKFCKDNSLTKETILGKTPISKTKHDRLEDRIKKVIRNDMPRFHFFPLEQDILIVDRVVDFEIIGSLPINSLNLEDRIARLRSPFKEQLIHRYSHHGMRIGTEDLSRELVDEKWSDIFSSSKIQLPTT